MSQYSILRNVQASVCYSKSYVGCSHEKVRRTYADVFSFMLSFTSFSFRIPILVFPAVSREVFLSILCYLLYSVALELAELAKTCNKYMWMCLTWSLHSKS